MKTFGIGNGTGSGLTDGFLQGLRRSASGVDSSVAASKGLSDLDHARMQMVLKHADPLYVEPIGKGVHRPYRVRLRTSEEKGLVTCSEVIFKTVNCQYETKRYCQSVDLSITGPERELLAYDMDRVLGFELVPPTVGRHVDGLGFGTVMAWVRAPLGVEWVKNGEYKYKNHPENPWFHRLAAFDFITGQIDRHCLPEGYLIKTDRGHVPIERVSVGDKVLTHRGRWRAVEDTFVKEYVGDLIEIECTRTSERLLLTPDHVLPVVRKRYRGKNGKRRDVTLSRIEWVKASEVDNDCVLLYPRMSEGVKTPSVSVVPLGNLSKAAFSRHPSELAIDKDFAALLGWYLAEGHVSSPVHSGKRYETSVVFSFGAHETDYIQEVVCLAKKYLGIDAKLRNQGSVTQVILYSSPFARFMSEIGGKGASAKHVPEWVLELPDDLLHIIIDRFAKGDGTKDDEHIRLRTVSYELATQLRDMLLKVGEYPTFRKAYSGGEASFGERRINQMDLWEVNYRPGGPLRNKFDVPGYLALPVFKVTRVPYKGFVHDLLVEEDHSFSTTSYVVHNCANWIMDKKRRVYAIDNGYSFVKGDDRRFMKCNVGKYLVGHPVHPEIQELLSKVDEGNIVKSLQNRGFKNKEADGVLTRFQEMRRTSVWGIMGGLWAPDKK